MKYTHYVALNTLALALFAGMSMRCHPASDGTDTLIAKHRQPKEILDGEDYEILSLVLKDICAETSSNVVGLEPTTLAGEYLFYFRSKESLEYIKDRFQVDATLVNSTAGRVTSRS